MRKDVKIGLAVAGVLFVVMIVYAMVPKGTGTHENPGDQANTNTGDDAGQHDPAVAGGGNDAPSVDSGGPHDASGTGGVASNDHTRPAGDPNTTPAQDDAFAAGNGNADPGAASADARGGTDWLKTFDTGNVVSRVESHPPLVAQTQTPGGGGESVIPAPGGVNSAMSGGEPAGSSGVPVIPSVGDAGGEPRSQQGNPADARQSSGRPQSPQRQAGPSGVVGGGDASRGSAGTPGRTHVMQRGETFASVAKAVYGKSSYYLQIQKANPHLNPNAVRPGTEITLPDVSAAPAGDAAAGSPRGDASSAAPRGGAAAAGQARGTDAAPVNASTEYRVQQGDSLYKISVKLYGNGSHVDELYENNAKTIGDDRARLKVGSVLKLHDAPRVPQR